MALRPATFAQILFAGVRISLDKKKIAPIIVGKSGAKW
jgi:hypothetical protein